MNQDTAERASAARQRAVARWWAHAEEFPRWYVWRGVAGHYYARVLGCSPPRVVRARSAEDLRGEILRVQTDRRPVPSQPYLYA